MTQATPPALRVDSLRLDNGLQLIGEYNPNAQSFAAAYLVKTGARDESPEVSGVSHFLEHMMFKGSDRRSAEDINREFDELGAKYNAFTSEEMTVYYGSVLPESAPQLLDLLSDMMRPALRQEDFDMEKNVILEEIAMYEDRPAFKVFERGMQHFWQGYPLGNSILGTAASIRDLQQAQMLHYFQQRYAPNNLILSLAGNYDWQAVTAQVQTLCGHWTSQDSPRDYPTLHSASGDVVAYDSKLKRPHVAMFAPGVSAQDPQRYAAALLASCVGDSSGSRLYWKLVDSGLVESASLSHDHADAAGNFIGYLSTSSAQLDAAMDIYREVLAEVEQQGVNAEEWTRAQRKLATSLTLRAETPFGRLLSLGTAYQYLGNYQSLPDIIDQVMATRPEDALRLLEQKPFSQALYFKLLPEQA